MTTTHEAHRETEPSNSAPLLRKRPTGGPAPLPRSFNRATTLGLAVTAAAVVLIAFSTNEAIRDRLWIPELRLMNSIADNRVSWLTTLLEGLYDASYRFAVPILVWIPVAVLIVTRRFRSALTFFAGFLLVVLAASVLEDIVLRPRPVGIEILGAWEGFAYPDRKVAAIAAAATSFALHSIPHGTFRRGTKVVAGVFVAVFAIAAVYLGVAPPTAVITSLAIGFSIPQLMFQWVTPPSVFPVKFGQGNTAHLEMTPQRVGAIQTGIVDQLGVAIQSAKPIALDGSAGSTPLLLETTEAPHVAPTLFAKLYAGSHLRSDRLYKIGRTLLYGRLEDEATFTSVRRLVEYEDYLATKMVGLGIRTAPCLGVVELTPEREYVAVFEFLSGSSELGDVIEAGGLTEQMIDDGIEIIDQLWHGGLAHRDIKPSNLMVTADGRVAVIDVAFGQVRPTRWRQSVDLGNMLLLLGLGAEASVVIERARVRFNADEIADALAAARGVAIPTQLRNALKASDRHVHRDLAALSPARPKVRLQRWSFTRLGLACSVVVAVLLALSLLAASARLAGLLP